MRTLIIDTAQITAAITIGGTALKANEALIFKLSVGAKNFGTRIRRSRITLMRVRGFSSLTARVGRALVRIVSSKRRPSKQQKQYR